MSKALIVVDHDECFRNLPFKPIILNDQPAGTKAEREALNALIITSQSNIDSLEAIPTCSPECGHLSYGYNVGVRCPKCNHVVESVTDRDMESTVWFQALKGTRSLINPLLWIMLSKIMTTSKYNVLMWLCNTYHEPPPEKNVRANTHIRKLTRSGVPRGLNSFVDNFDTLIPIIASMVPKVRDRTILIEFLMVNKHKFFPQSLPMPSNIAFVMEHTATGIYADTAMRDAIDAVRTVTSLDRATVSSVRRLEGKAATIVSDLSIYYTHMFGEPFGKKEGWIRNSCLGTRSPNSFRTVITSGGTTELSDYDGIKLPYTTAVVVFKVHLENLLCQGGMSIRDAWDYIEIHTNTRDAYLVSLLYHIFTENRSGRGTPTLLVRNPTLLRGSIQCVYINGLSEATMDLHILICPSYNADYIFIVV